MRKHKLSLEDLAVESFNTEEVARLGGTVKAHQEDDEYGTFLSMCRSCPNTCDEYTCQSTCPPRHTCVMDTTCWPEYTCGGPDCGNEETVLE